MREKTIHDIMRRLILVLLVTAFAFSLCVPFVSADDVSGTCGNSLTWTLIGDTLTISGQGAMTNYTEKEMAPWYDACGILPRQLHDAGVFPQGRIGADGHGACRDCFEA